MTEVRIERFPVVIPDGFAPSDSERDGADIGGSGKRCPGQDPRDGYRPRWGGGFRAARLSPQPDGSRKTVLHRAIDVMAAEGAHAVAICAGTIARTWRPRPGVSAPGAGTSERGGHYVVLDTDDGWRWYYAHLRDVPLVVPGQYVEAGELLGYVGRTGNARRRYRQRDGTYAIRGCPHLHLSMTGLTRANLAVARKGGLDVHGDKIDCVPLLRPLYLDGGWQG